VLTQDFVGVTENSANSGIHVLEKVSGEEIIKHGITHSDRTTAFDIVAYYGGNQRNYPGGARLVELLLSSFPCSQGQV